VLTMTTMLLRTRASTTRHRRLIRATPPSNSSKFSCRAEWFSVWTQAPVSLSLSLFPRLRLRGSYGLFLKQRLDSLFLHFSSLLVFALVGSASTDTPHLKKTTHTRKKTNKQQYNTTRQTNKKTAHSFVLIAEAKKKEEKRKLTTSAQQQRNTDTHAHSQSHEKLFLCFLSFVL